MPTCPRPESSNEANRNKSNTMGLSTSKPGSTSRRPANILDLSSLEATSPPSLGGGEENEPRGVSLRDPFLGKTRALALSNLEVVPPQEDTTAAVSLYATETACTASLEHCNVRAADVSPKRIGQLLKSVSLSCMPKKKKTNRDVLATVSSVGVAAAVSQFVGIFAGVACALSGSDCVDWASLHAELIEMHQQKDKFDKEEIELLKMGKNIVAYIQEKKRSKEKLTRLEKKAFGVFVKVMKHREESKKWYQMREDKERDFLELFYLTSV